ncbi:MULTISPECIES: AbiH family protein [Enterococcus]|uniref:AbiH family protein n=1 Tax=Enterococcus TaxID=1350 RepID=UPI001106E9E6|nr:MULTISPECIES: AbiH family protein [Enterococcus]MDB1680785.1 AbiH family protein [Enterococcus durans]
MNNKKLIILGNGFDLACNLKSTYKAFFENRITSEIREVLNDALQCFRDQMISDDLFGYNTIFKVKEPKDYFQTRRTLQVNNGTGTHSVYGVIRDSNLTFWDLIFYYSGGSEKDLQWQDIEQKMLDFFCFTDEDTKFPNLNMIKKTLRGVFSSVNAETLICLHLASFLPDRIEYENKNLLNYLYDELRTFENNFAEYIRNIINDDYESKACNLLLAMVEASSIPHISDKVFSFNYTNPFKDQLKIINVHGTVKENNIIFGIDQENVDPTKDIYRFTKTFRQMTETKLAVTYQENILPDKEEIDEIVFFGHSLSTLDYSYFQTIFDHYELYQSKIRLVFYYKKYGDYTREDMELDLAQKISKMLYTYSPSIDNPKKGKNLLHKLLLEKRLIIEEIR